MQYKEPNNERAEIEVLGSMMNDEKALYDGLSGLNEEFFTSDERREVFRKIGELSEGGRVTAKMVINKLSGTKEKALVRTADSAYVDYDHYKREFDELTNYYIKRCLYYTTKSALEQTQTDTKGNKIADYLGEKISEVYFDDTGMNIVDPTERAAEGLNEFYEGLDDPESSYGLRFSIPTEKGSVGLPALDHCLMGAHKGDLIMIAAKTGEGKTALGINIARLFSIYNPHYGYYANAEMRLREMEARLLSPVAKVPAKEIAFSILEGTQAERDAKKTRVGAAYDRYRNSKLFLSRIPSLSVSKIRGLAKQIKIKHKKLDYIIVDYIQRMDLSVRSGEKDYDALKRAAMKLKELAIELDIPIIILAQRNQDGDVEGAKAMMNECDAVLYFEPVNENDEEHIMNTFTDPQKRQKVNYKIVKRKVRRDDNPFPIYCSFDKKFQFINEVGKQ